MSHIFRIGDIVTMAKGASDGIATGRCEIVRTLPSSTDDEPRYHVKCGEDRLVRSARQADLTHATQYRGFGSAAGNGTASPAVVAVQHEGST